MTKEQPAIAQICSCQVQLYPGVYGIQLFRYYTTALNLVFKFTELSDIIM